MQKRIDGSLLFSGNLTFCSINFKYISIFKKSYFSFSILLLHRWNTRTSTKLKRCHYSLQTSSIFYCSWMFYFCISVYLIFNKDQGKKCVRVKGKNQFCYVSSTEKLLKLPYEYLKALVMAYLNGGKISI